MGLMKRAGTFLLISAFAVGVVVAQDGDDEKPKPTKKKGADELPDEPLPRARALMNKGRHDEALALARSLADADAKDKAPRKLLA
jgi:hypothetical protein